jgi:hypothetical protein
MLSDYEQEMVWERWLSAEIRAAYFAALVGRFQLRQKLLVLGSLLLSSGATITLLTTVLPPTLNWIKPVLTLLAAALSLWSLVAKNERGAMDCADLHFRWNTLALGYESLWSNVYADNALETLDTLRKEEALASKSSTAFPAYKKLLEEAQDNVVMHHQHQIVV